VLAVLITTILKNLDGEVKTHLSLDCIDCKDKEEQEQEAHFLLEF
jgi:hypothetical protein